MRTLTPILFLVVAGCFGANAKQGEPKKGEKEKEAKIVRPGQPVVYDGVKVELVEKNNEKFFYQYPFGKNHRKATIRVTNETKNEIMNFKAWSVEKTAAAKDEFGNNYPISDMRPQNNKRLDPGQSYEDVIFFEIPQKAAKEITITLPGDSISRKGDVVCKIPVSWFEIPKN